MRKLFFISTILLLFSCSEKKMDVLEPYANHRILLGLPENINSVIYTRQIYEVTDGGYFLSKQRNSITSVFGVDYPYDNSIIYSSNTEVPLINNYPITPNQDFINNLKLFNTSVLDGYDKIRISFYKDKIKEYIVIKDGLEHSILCSFDKDDDIVKVNLTEPYYLSNKKENLKVRKTKISYEKQGAFLKKKIVSTDVYSDTTSYQVNKIDAKKIEVLDSNNKKINVQLNDQNQISKIESDDKKYSIRYKDNKVIEKYDLDNKSNYKSFVKADYDKNQVKSIVKASSSEKINIFFNLNGDYNIESISFETDKSKNKKIDVNFNYVNNEKGDWVEMSCFRDRKLYDYYSKKEKDILKKLKNEGYSTVQANFSEASYKANMNKKIAQQMCSKIIFSRQLDYSK